MCIEVFNIEVEERGRANGRVACWMIVDPAGVGWMRGATDVMEQSTGCE